MLEEEQEMQEEQQDEKQIREDTVLIVDYRNDVMEWIEDNNKELKFLEEATSGLLKAFKHSPDFYDGLRRIDAKSDLGRIFLELVTRFMGRYEKSDDSMYKAEVTDYIVNNTNELGKVQEKINYLLKAYDYAEDFLVGLERLEPKTDLPRSLVELLTKFIIRGLDEEPEE